MQKGAVPALLQRKAKGMQVVQMKSKNYDVRERSCRLRQDVQPGEVCSDPLSSDQGVQSGVSILSAIIWCMPTPISRAKARAVFGPCAS